MKKTKIICTIGPASASPAVLEKMMRHGMNVARLNFSHGTYENHSLLVKNIRSASKKVGVPVAIMQDLQGPKIRVSELSKPVRIKVGQQVVIGQHFNVDFDISGSVKSGERILIEDGTIELKVLRVTAGKANRPIICKAVTSGEIRSHKGINLPDSKITFPIFTKKDIEDLKFGLKLDVDYVALSFVRDDKDIVKIQKLISEYNPKGYEVPKVIAKIERGEALKNFDKILSVADAIMVARGDLGVEIADSQVPLVQKNLIGKCIAAAKPVIVATQMLDSMTRNPRPTRAEVSDVANAVIDDADAVMLSGESAFGQYPVEAVMEMERIIQATEGSPYDVAKIIPFTGTDTNDQKAGLIAGAVHQLAEGIDVKAIIGTSASGYTARFISRQRVQRPILLLTDRPKVFRQMCLNWGVTPVYVKSMKALKNFEGLLNYLVSEARKHKLVKIGQKVVLVAGRPLGERMNTVQVITVK